MGLREHRGALELVAMGVGIEATLVLLSASGVDRTSPVLEALYSVSFLAYCLAVFFTLRRTAKEEWYVWAVLVLAFAALFRLTFLAQQPTLSGDVYRYYWDGKLINNGISPYSYAPYASQLSSLRDANWLLVQDKDIVSPYPPLLELLNAIVYFLSPNIAAFKLTFSLLDVAVVGALIMVLGRLGLDRRLAVIYGWNPLFVLEFGSSAHSDPLAIFFVLISVYLFLGAKRLSSAATLALAILSKIYPIFMAPYFVKKWGAKGVALFSLLVIAAYLPFIYLGNDIIQVLSVYALSSRSLFNGGAFAVLQLAFSSLGSASALLAARAVAYGILGGAISWTLYRLLRKPHDDLSFVRGSVVALTVYLALSATMEPWYVAWVFPFLAFLSSDAIFVFSWTVFLTYLTYAQVPISPGYWAEITWVRIVEYVPLYLMLGYESLKRRLFSPRASASLQA